MSHPHSVRTVKQAYQPNLGKSSEQTALMVKITWTKAPIVHVKVNKNFKMDTSTLSINKKGGYQVISNQQIPVQEGMEFYFVRSSEGDWYYVCRWSESFHQFSCSCPAGRMKHECKHIEMVVARVATTTTPVAEIITVGSFQRMIEAAKTQSRQLSKPKPVVVEEVSDDEVDRILAEIDELDKAS